MTRRHAVIAGATVTVIDVARGAQRDLVTDSAGEYGATNLIPGTYTVRAPGQGLPDRGAGQRCLWRSVKRFAWT